MVFDEKIRLSTQMKCTGDGYCGGYTCGMSMLDSETMERMHLCQETEERSVYRNEAGVVLVLQKRQAEHAVRVKTIVENNSPEDICIEMLSTFVLEGVKADQIHRMQSFWSAEGRLRTETTQELMLEPSWNHHGARIEKFGNVGSLPVRKYFPWLVLEERKKKRFLGIQLYCAFSWQMELKCQRDETLTVLGGMADRDFGQWKKTLRPGERLETPEAVIAEGTSLEEVCSRLVGMQRPDISPIDRRMGIAFNEYCTTWGNPSFDNLKNICDRIAGKGIQYLTIDSGWYAQAENWWDRIGEWEVNRKRFPEGMKPLCDYIRSKGMIPGLWFELEGVSAQCAYYGAEEHLIRKDGRPLTVGGKRFFDLEDPWVVEYLSEKVIGLLRESGFGYLKVDDNETLGIGCDDPDGFGEGLRKKILAVQRFFRKIKEELPELVIENCASGGHRLEPSMMELVSQASFSDAHETKAVPIIAANLHRVIRPDQNQIWAVVRAGDDDTRLQYSMINTFLGRMCLSGDIYQLSDHQWKVLEEGMEFYRKVADIIAQGRTLCQSGNPGSYNRPQGEQLVLREWQGRYLAVYHRFEHSSPLPSGFWNGKRLLAAYGCADRDFSAQAWLYTQDKE